MKVERAVDTSVKESSWPITLDQSGIPVPSVFMPKDSVLRTIVRMDKCTCVDS